LARYRIRYQGTDLEMPPGEFVVGRGSTCHLALDDALVSRRHATIHVQPEGVFVEDLGSRNGVAVNGERVTGRQRVSNLDRITIGAHELVLVEIPDRAKHSASCDACHAPLPVGSRACPKCGNVSRPTLAGMTLEMPAQKSDAVRTVKLDAPVVRMDAARADPTSPRSESMRTMDSGEESTGRELLTGIADKALALGRFDEAERVLGKQLQDILALARGTRPPKPERVQEGTKYALRLAEGTKRAQWIDWVFDIHEATSRMMTADNIERIHDLVRKLRYRGVVPVRRYLEAMRNRASELNPSERFLLSRLEGIERMVSA
jgi:hypothetical protein